MENVIVGLIKGRHEMPVSKYIFEREIENVHDYKAIGKHIINFLETEGGIVQTYGSGINQIDFTDVQILQGKRNLVVYITGLTCVTAELITLCTLNGIHLTLMNFDTTTGTYKKQNLF